jgi:hypothetical protein
MFELSKNRTEELNIFLEKKKLLNTESPDFGITTNSAKLHTSVDPATEFPKPIVLFSLIPKFPNSEKITQTAKEFKTWLTANDKGHQPFPGTSIYNPGYESDLMLDGIIMKHTYNKQLLSYFEILNNGYVEAGFSDSFVYPYEKSGKSMVAFYLTPIIGYEMLLLNFARKLYHHVQYYDDVLLQISFVNMLNLRLYGFHSNYDNMWTRYEHSDTSNMNNANFKLLHSFNLASLDDERILEIAKETSGKIGRVFGFDTDFCFVEDKLSQKAFNNFSLYPRI